ncbi:hypothetical protein AGMMS50249_3490 [candidate division SR1 bacterium]|nr:hypothetical protein AGMMS50249_3490 [candidate division SR1 bacterium]
MKFFTTLENGKHSVNIWFCFFCALFIFNVLVIVGGFVAKNTDTGFDFLRKVSGYYAKYDKFTLIDSYLERDFIDPGQLSGAQNAMLDNALKAYVAGLDDPYSNYLTKDEAQELNNILHDQVGISGIGAVVEKKDTYVQIDEVIKNGPAYKAGLLPLDRILFIETGSTIDLDTSEAVSRIRGQKGSSVLLTIQRIEKDGNMTGFEVEIVRDNIEIPSVMTDIIDIKGKKIGHFMISSISDSTTSLFLKEFVEVGPLSGMILDLRGNGGGYLEEAIKFLGHFLPKGSIVVATEYQGYEPIEFSSKGRGELAYLPKIILVDQLTASAGEIIAITLQENGVKIVGMDSFGKGTIQTVQELPDGSSLKYTIGKWLSPGGTWVNGTGVIPDEIVQRDMDKYINDGIDNQLEKAEELLEDQL